MFARLALLTVLIALVGPASAQASSIVCTKADGNAWLVNPDGSGEHQVTLDGSAATPYEEASEADDGTNLARHGGRSVQGSLQRLSQNGGRLGEPISPLPPVLPTLAQLGPSDPEISPDGRTVPYTVARGRGRLARGSTTVTVRVDRAVRRRLARSRAMRVTLRVVPGADDGVTRTLQITR